jgi:hypothetical protein
MYHMYSIYNILYGMILDRHSIARTPFDTTSDRCTYPSYGQVGEIILVSISVSE